MIRTPFLCSRARGRTGGTGDDGTGRAIWSGANLSLSRCLLANKSAEGGTGTNGVGGNGQGGTVCSVGGGNTVVGSTFFGNTASGGLGSMPNRPPLSTTPASQT